MVWALLIPTMPAFKQNQNKKLKKILSERKIHLKEIKVDGHRTKTKNFKNG